MPLQKNNELCLNLFEIVDKNNIRLKGNVNIVDKETYSFRAIYSVNANGARLVLTGNENKISFKTKKTRISIIEKMTNVYNTENESKTIYLQALNGAQQLEIERIEPTNMIDDFGIEAEGNSVKITYLYGGNCKKGKEYTLKMNVYFKGAPRNSKPTTVNYKVKIAK